MNNYFCIPTRALLPLLLVTLLVGCSQPEAQMEKEVAPTVVKLSEVIAIPELNEFTFPAVVSAVKTVDVRFEVSGRIVQMDMVAGKDVSKGHLLATIDPQPFKRRVQEQQARRDQAQRDMQRTAQMFEKGLVAQSSLDSAKTEFELADLELGNALQDLSYTKLSAPFDAQVSQRLVENNSFVSKGETIAKLQDVSRIFFTVNVPERLVTANAGRGIDSAKAAILTMPDQWFDVEYVEYSAQPDPVTQTYEVKFAMAPNDELNLTPGARAVVKTSVNSELKDSGVLIPINALVGNNDQGFHVWKYTQNQQSVIKVGVDVLQMKNELALVSGELMPGDFLVSAGASKMFQGISVKPYTAEQ
ncbi:efflux RND transporter periplasmic adaptor subunit [Aliiglaciecola sp. LCG003]|uniref:efflux RND transporter periplasmic adaptor subunit n=1 Tax=Aliiglaciecola sp. LCG003 TaxID=3053655 RepID=UPI0025748EEF|nr:efflux RND transporter periplasmic adaptor subunit [Aliiglaciecola sp. LCG003]WJG09195.1 efflux RND transporter periplasmic adaptor subunit [Aliiglaciecola sp. LCG003]